MFRSGCDAFYVCSFLVVETLGDVDLKCSGQIREL